MLLQILKKHSAKDSISKYDSIEDVSQYCKSCGATGMPGQRFVSVSNKTRHASLNIYKKNCLPSLYTLGVCLAAIQGCIMEIACQTKI